MRGRTLGFRRTVVRFLRDRSGGTAIEYALICALVFLAIATALKGYGTEMGKMFDYVSTTIRKVL